MSQKYLSRLQTDAIHGLNKIIVKLDDCRQYAEDEREVTALVAEIGKLKTRVNQLRAKPTA